MCWELLLLVKKEEFFTLGRSGFKFTCVLLLIDFFKTTNPQVSHAIS